jgi:hypothetical protein
MATPPYQPNPALTLRSPIRCLCCGAPERQVGCAITFACTCTPYAGFFRDGLEHYCNRCRMCDMHCMCPGGPASQDVVRRERERERERRGRV